VGQRDVIAITNIEASLEDLNRASPMGNQAMGETGLSTCTMGFKISFSFELIPMRKPAGRAIREPIRKPRKTLFRDVSNCHPIPLSLGPRS